jgi:transcriptional regulator of acetoin/glycerol metabolism
MKKQEWNNLESIEKNHIKTILRRFGGDIKKAAETLGVSRATLYRKLKKFQVTR